MPKWLQISGGVAIAVFVGVPIMLATLFIGGCAAMYVYIATNDDFLSFDEDAFVTTDRTVVFLLQSPPEFLLPEPRIERFATVAIVDYEPAEQMSPRLVLSENLHPDEDFEPSWRPATFTVWRPPFACPESSGGVTVVSCTYYWGAMLSCSSAVIEVRVQWAEPPEPASEQAHLTALAAELDRSCSAFTPVPSPTSSSS